MDALLTTSFDRFARYSYTYRLRIELLPESPLRILDVGDPFGTLAPLFPDDLTVSLDLFTEGEVAGSRHEQVVGSGFLLPFPDAAFDLVTAHDVLEHVPDAGRGAFLQELLRVSRGPVVVAAPFADPRTQLCERLVRQYYVDHVGSPLEPLEEHAEHGLPDLEAVRAILREAGVEHLVYSDGWLFHWLAFMLLKAHYVSIGAVALDRATDATFNRLLREPDRRPPHYRRAIILRPPDDAVQVLGPSMGAEPGDVDGGVVELERLARDISGVLRPGEDPSRPDSALWRWLEDDTATSEEEGLVKSSLSTALRGARARLADPELRKELRLEPTVTAVVLRRPGDAARSVASAIRGMDGIERVILCDRPDSSTPPAGVDPLHVEGDDALQLAAAVEVVTSEAILVVDPDISVEEVQVRRLIDAYDSTHPVVGFHRLPGGGFAQAAGVMPDGDGALYVARELFLIRRDIYRGGGGLDGRFRGVLDDVDLGWRLNLMGFAVTTVGPATWPGAPPSPEIDVDVAVLWTWIKNLDLPALEKVLPYALLSHLVTRGGGVEVTAHLDSLLEARISLAQLRTVDDHVVRARFGNLRLGRVRSEESRTLRLLDQTFEQAPWPPSRPSRLLVIAGEGSATRSLALAVALSRVVDVSIVGAPAGDAADGLTLVPREDVGKHLDHVDVVLVPAPMYSMVGSLLDTWRGVVIVDLYEDDDSTVDGALARGDVFLCRTPEARERWESVLLQFGRGIRADDRVEDLLRSVPPGDEEGAAGGVSVADVRRLRDVVLRPWRWRWAHAGGVVPLESSPAVAELLERREVEVTAAISTVLQEEMRRQVEDAARWANDELASTRTRLAALEDELNQVRQEAHRWRSHPAIRVALLVRRMLRPS